MHITFATVLAMLLLLFLATASSAQTINGCVKDKNGALRIVADSSGCTSRETAISWNQQGPQGKPGSDAEVLHVFDGTGRDLGLFGGFYFSPLEVDIYFKAFGTVAAVGVHSGLPTLKISGDLYWESSDCTGQAYFVLPSRLFIESVSGTSVYAATRGEVASILPRSTSSRVLFPSPAECLTTTNPDLLLAAPIDLLDPLRDLGVSFPLAGPLYVGLPAE